MQASTVPCDKAGSQLACAWSINYCLKCTRDGLLHAVLAVAKDSDIVIPVYRFSFGVNFASQEDKDALLYRLCEARRILKQPDNTAQLCAMRDLALAAPSPATSTGPSSFMETSYT